MDISEFLVCNYRDFEDEIMSGPKNALYSYLNPQNFQVYSDIVPNSSIDIFYRIDGVFTIFLLRSLIFNADVTVKRQSFDFTSIADCFFSHCVGRKLKIFAAGGSVEDNYKFIINIQARYPGLDIQGLDGYCSKEVLSQSIRSYKPDVLLFGLGNGKQEVWGCWAVEQFGLPVFTCGAFISQTAKRGGSGSIYCGTCAMRFRSLTTHRYCSTDS